VVWTSYLIYLIFRVRFIVCYLFLYVIFFQQRADSSRAEGGRFERAIFDDTRADRANDTRADRANDTRIDLANDTCIDCANDTRADRANDTRADRANDTRIDHTGQQAKTI